LRPAVAVWLRAWRRSVAGAHQITGRDLGGGARVLFLEPRPGAQRLALRAIDTRLGEQKDQL